jgi:VCBS repeat-containing protein
LPSAKKPSPSTVSPSPTTSYPRPGGNGIFEGGDDSIIAFTSIFTLGSHIVTLRLDDGILAPGDYRLFVSVTAAAFTNSPGPVSTAMKTATKAATTDPILAIDANSANTTRQVFGGPNPGETFAINHDSAEFSIDVTGVITPLLGLNHEDTPGYSFTVTVTDAQGLAPSATVTVEIAGVNEAPVIGDASFLVDENTIAIGSVTGTNSEDDSLRYSIPGPFSIDDNGVLRANVKER